MTTYNAYLDGIKVKEGITKSPFILDGLKSDKVHGLEITEVNSAGVESPKSSPATNFKTLKYFKLQAIRLNTYFREMEVGDTVVVNPQLLPAISSISEFTVAPVKGYEEFITVSGNSITAVKEGRFRYFVSATEGDRVVSITSSTLTIYAKGAGRGLREIRTATVGARVGEHIALHPRTSPMYSSNNNFEYSTLSDGLVINDGLATALKVGEHVVKVVEQDTGIAGNIIIRVSDKVRDVFFRNPKNGDTLAINPEGIVVDLGFLPEGLTPAIDGAVCVSSDESVAELTVEQPESELDEDSTKLILKTFKEGTAELNISFPEPEEEATRALTGLSRTITIHVK